MIDATAGNGSKVAGLSRPALFALAYASAFLGSKYLGLSTGYALDDYAVSHTSPEGLAGFFLSQGRYTNAVLDTILRASDLNMTSFSVIAFIATLIFSTLFYLAVFKPDSRQQPSTIAAAAALLGAHSYYTEYITFRQSALPMSVMFAMLWVAIGQYRIAMFTADGRTVRLAVAAAAGVIAMGANQLALCYAAIAVLYMHLAVPMAGLREGSAAPLLPQVSKAVALTAACGFVLSAGNLLAAMIGRIVGHVGTDGRAALVSAGQLPERAAQLMELMPRLLIKAEPIAATPAKVLLLLSVLLALLPFGRAYVRGRLLVLLFAATAWGIALLPHVVSGTWWPVPRTLVAIPMVFAGVLVLCSHAGQLQLRVSAGLALAAAVLFCAHSNAILINQQRVNRWDIAQAQDIASRVAERFPQKHAKLAIVGGKWSYAVAPQAAQGDMNLSALSVGWAIDPLFDEATGIDLSVRSAPELAETCAGKPVFPSPESTIEAADEIIVCL